MATDEGKLRVGILFGGRSAEHDVSIMSARNVLKALRQDRYEAVPIFVTRDGRWLLSRYADGDVAMPDTGDEACLLPGGRGRLLAVPQSGAPREIGPIDVLFPVLHGQWGEDGSVQGMAEVARVPLVGCGILGSATALDKSIAKRLFVQAGIPAARSVTIRRSDTPSFEDLSRDLGLPMFVKPATQGSSVGVSKVSGSQEWTRALESGFMHDDTLLVEEFVKAREIECAVLETPSGELFVSRPGEIAAAESHGFYSYDAKYVDDAGAVITVPAKLPVEVEEEVRRYAALAFRALGCDGMARADFFVTEDHRILVNELNTIPGFTNISMYPKAMEASGVGYSELIDKLIEHGLARGQVKLPS
jgi:D-alanine-D-alanine ligase